MSEKGKDPKTVAVVGGAHRPVYAMDLKGGILFSGSSDRSVRQHQATDQIHVRSYLGHTDSVYSVHYHEDTKRLATGSYNGEVQIFDAESGKLVSRITVAPGYQSATAERQLAF
jgi:WD40 repeat protein